MVAVVAATAVIGAAGLLMVTAAGDPESTGPGQRVQPPGERLVPELEFVAMYGDAQRDQSSELQIPFFEVLPDGSVLEIPLEVSEHTIVNQLRPLSDGRLVALASRDLMPDVDQADGPSVEGVAYPLLVVGADGGVETDDDVRVVGEYPTLIGVTAGDVILQRHIPDDAGPAKLVARDRATGAERVLGQVDKPASDGDIASGRLVLAAGAAVDSPQEAGSCWLTTFETSAAGRESRATLPACDQIVGVNASPDGRSVAVVYQRLSEPAELRLRIMDLEAADSGAAVLVDELLRHPDPCTKCLVAAQAGYLGMAWSDHTTLRVALMSPMPIDHDRAEFLEAVQDRLEIHTRTLPA